MAGVGDFYTARDTFGQLNQWISTLNTQAKKSVETAYKAERVTFVGGQATSGMASSRPSLLSHQAEQALHARIATDYSQGQILASTDNTHLAVKGEGWFILTDSKAQDGKLYYTRDGEFSWNDEGLLVNRDGLYVLGADNVGAVPGLVSPPDWLQAGPAWGGGMPGIWYPGGTAGNHPIGTYTDPIAFQKSVYVPGPDPVTITIETREDACARFFVDGVEITAAAANPYYPGYDYIQTALPYTFTLAPGEHLFSILAFDDNFNNSHVKIKTLAGPIDLTTEPTEWKTVLSVAGLGDDWMRPRDLISKGADTIDGYINPHRVGLALVGDHAKDLQSSLLGKGLFETVPGRPHPAAGGAGIGGRGTVVTGALEASNVNMAQLSPELALSKVVYENLTKVLMARVSNLDLLMNLIR